MRTYAKNLENTEISREIIVLIKIHMNLGGIYQNVDFVLENHGSGKRLERLCVEVVNW
jgi:hypothetical protein